MADFSLIVDVLNELKSKRKGQFLENIEDLMSKYHQWDNEKTRNELEKLVHDNSLKKCKVNEKFSYRLVKDNVHFEDISTEDACEQEVSSFNVDYEDFKKFVTTELSGIKEILASSTKCSCAHNNDTSLSSPDISPDSFAIQCLQAHIKSLENELSAKQEIINKLLDKSEQFSPVLKEDKIERKITKKAVSKIKSNNSETPVIDKVHRNDNIVIIGDSLLNGIKANGFKKQNVTIKAHSGATSEDIIHYIKPVINKKPDKVIIHCGTNDIPKDIKTIDNLKKIDDYIKVNSPNTKLVLSAIITRQDNREYGIKVGTMNERLKKFTNKNNIDLICHTNIDESLLNPKKLHLNKKGYSYLANDFINYLDKN